MNLSAIKPNEKLSDALKICFQIIFVLLLMKFIVDLYREPFSLQKLADEPFYIKLISRYAGIFSRPFDDSIMAFFGYAICYIGIFLKIPEERENLFMNKILDTCRVIFFLAGTLLILLGVARMGVLLYQDIAVGNRIDSIVIKSQSNQQK